MGPGAGQGLLRQVSGSCMGATPFGILRGIGTFLYPWILSIHAFQSFPKHTALPRGWAEGDRKAELMFPWGRASPEALRKYNRGGFQSATYPLHQLFDVVQGMPESHSVDESQNSSLHRIM